MPVHVVPMRARPHRTRSVPLPSPAWRETGLTLAGSRSSRPTSHISHVSIPRRLLFLLLFPAADIAFRS